MGAQAAKSIARVLLRGESLVASGGLGAAAILVVALAACTFWSQRTTRRELESARREHVRAVAGMLAQTSELMLQAGAVAELRTLVAGTLASQSLRHIQITLPDGTPIADSDLPRTGPSAANYKPLPGREVWSALKQPLTETRTTIEPSGAVEVRVPMIIPDLGPAILAVKDEGTVAHWTGWELQAGAAAIGVFSLAGVWLAYRLVRRRLRALGAVREALASLNAGERSVQALMVAPTLGAEALAWNRLLSDYEQLREKTSHERAGEKIGAKRGRESELSNVCDALWQGLLVIEAKSVAGTGGCQVRYANGAGAIFLKARREELVGADAAKHLDPRVLEAVRSVLSGTARTRVSVEVEQRSDDPTVRVASVLRFSVRPIRRDDAPLAVVMIEDVTQQRLADESRNAFVASATHELRTPLTNMRLYLDQLLEEPDLDASKRAQAINVVSTESRRLERIVGDMLSVAEIEAGQLKLHRGDVRLEPVFTALQSDFAEQARRQNQTLRFELPPKWPTMTGDRDKIVLALHNLVGNALKYTPSGGEITVRASEAPGPPAALNVEVADTGFGINAEETELIFEKFYRAKDRRVAEITGTGLGLSLAREVARMHGGDVSVRSQLDKGSTFTITLPLAA